MSANKNHHKIHKDDTCLICGELFLDEEKQLNKAVVNGELVGICHTDCYMPYMGQSNLKILIRISVYSIGDTIAVTPVLREIRRIYPNAKLTVLTMYPDLFKYNPNVSSIIDMKQDINPKLLSQFLCELNAFDTEKVGHFAVHSVEFSALCALGHSILPNNWQYELYYTPDDHAEAVKIAAKKGIDPVNDKLILIHPHKTEWATRDWGSVHFKELARMIQERYPDHKLVSIGGSRKESKNNKMDNKVEIDGAVDMYGEFSLLQSAAFMDFPAIKCLVTPDTGTLHLAATRPELPIVGIFTLIKSFFRTPVRKGLFSYKFIGVESDSGCNCTYDARFITEASDFHACPKFTYLDRTARLNLNGKLKANYYQNVTGNEVKNQKDIGKLIKQERDKYAGDDLVCFPRPEKVMKAVETLMEKYGE